MEFLLPWLRLSVAAPQPLLAEVQRALFKLSTGSTPTGMRELTAELSLDDRAEPLSLAAHVWEEGELRYQFVRGRVTAEGAQFATAAGSLLDLVLPRRRLRGMIRSTTFTAPYSTWADFVLAPLTEFWRANELFPLHAAAVELGGEAFLVPGYSGAGKTSLCLALDRAGATWRADDKLLFAAGKDEIRAVSLYRNTNLHPETVRRVPGLDFTLARAPIDETNPKRPCLMTEVSGSIDLGEFRPTALLFPSVGGGAQSEIRSASRMEAHLRLAAQSPTSSYAGRVRTHVQALSTVACSLPALTVSGGEDVFNDPDGLAERLLAAVRGVQSESSERSRA